MIRRGEDLEVRACAACSGDGRIPSLPHKGPAFLPGLSSGLVAAACNVRLTSNPLKQYFLSVKLESPSKLPSGSGRMMGLLTITGTLGHRADLRELKNTF